MPRPAPPPSLAVRRALASLGEDIAAARRRRRLPIHIVAERALTTRQTVARIEGGDPSVAMATWASVLFSLGLLDRLAELAAPAHDEVGLALESAELPRRVRLPRPSKSSSGESAP
ncbi:MAG: hypothetical protein ABIT38_16510 [Gemmatimonadaceae bacterium]